MFIIIKITRMKGADLKTKAVLAVNKGRICSVVFLDFINTHLIVYKNQNLLLKFPPKIGTSGLTFSITKPFPIKMIVFVMPFFKVQRSQNSNTYQCTRN